MGQEYLRFNGDKVFGIGLGRTGTNSLATAMSILGYKSRHGLGKIGYDNVYNYDFMNDAGIAVVYDFLDYAFPKAKFILTVRDVDSWIKSAATYSKRRNKGGYFSEDGLLDIPLRRAHTRFALYRSTYFDEATFRKVHAEFDKKVIKHFAGRDDKLLLMNICKGDGWDKLCHFLGKDIPTQDFPHLNKSVYA